MTEHAEAIEADLLRYYGVDILDYHRGLLSARRLRVLVQHLPRDAALVRAVRGEAADWGPTEHLLAVAADELAIGNWLFASAHTAESADRPERPQPIRRPGADSEADPEAGPAPDGGADAVDGHAAAATPEQIAAFFGAPAPRR
ncbi:MAG TPA: hypothetical protein VF069_05315 [Streptosporangiaceae bacterium]